MKIGYSQISLLLFVIAIVLKAISVFAFESVFLTVGFFAAVVIGIVLIGAETFRQKKFADAFVFENKFHISFFSILASVGFFVDFIPLFKTEDTILPSVRRLSDLRACLPL